MDPKPITIDCGRVYLIVDANILGSDPYRTPEDVVITICDMIMKGRGILEVKLIMDHVKILEKEGA